MTFQEKDLFSRYMDETLVSLSQSKCHAEFEQIFQQLAGILYLDSKTFLRTKDSEDDSFGASRLKQIMYRYDTNCVLNYFKPY